MNKGRSLAAYLLLLPAALYMVLLVGYPIVSNLILSFQNVDVMTFALPEHAWVGLQTYVDLFKQDVFSIAVANTIIFTLVSIFFQFCLGFSLALLFSRSFPLSQGIRGILVVTWMLPVTVTALIFKYMMSPADGIIDYALIQLGILQKPISWLIDPNTALTGIMIANVWIGVPFNMILLSTALSTVPKQLYESAKVDGASAFQAFWVITVPYLKGAIFSVFVLGFIYTFRVFELVFMMTNGGPVNATEVLSTVSYQKSFVEFNFSSGAATANVLFVVLFAVSLVYLRLIKKEEKF